jgi:hypothetical protein
MMQRLADKHSPALALQALQYLQIALRKHPDTAELAPDIASAREALKAADDVANLALTERMVATGQVQFADAALDDAVMSLSRALLDRVEGDRSDPRFTRLFPKSPTEATRPVGGEKQATFVRVLLDTLRSDDAYADFADRADRIEAAFTALEEAQKERAERQVAVEKANRDRRAAQAEAQAVYNKMHPRLQLMIDSKARVESFFMKLG